MIERIKRWLSKPKKNKVPLYPFAVEAVLMLDENTVLSKFVCTIEAQSKRDAKEQVRTRAFVKVGAVANKKQIETYLKIKK